MRAFEFCIRTRSTIVPSGPDWFHEIKYDGYRLRLERDGRGARLMTRGGYNFADCYPWIVEAARKVRQTRFVIDGEAVVLGVDVIADFDALHSRKHDDEVQLYAFDILALVMVKICAACRCPCARPTSPSYWRGGLTASSSRRSSRVKSGLTCLVPPATWGWKGLVGPSFSRLLRERFFPAYAVRRRASRERCARRSTAGWCLLAGSAVHGQTASKCRSAVP